MFKKTNLLLIVAILISLVLGACSAFESDATETPDAWYSQSNVVYVVAAPGSYTVPAAFANGYLIVPIDGYAKISKLAGATKCGHVIANGVDIGVVDSTTAVIQSQPMYINPMPCGTVVQQVVTNVTVNVTVVVPNFAETVTFVTQVPETQYQIVTATPLPTQVVSATATPTGDGEQAACFFYTKAAMKTLDYARMTSNPDIQGKMVPIASIAEVPAWPDTNRQVEAHCGLWVKDPRYALSLSSTEGLGHYPTHLEALAYCALEEVVMVHGAPCPEGYPKE